MKKGSEVGGIKSSAADSSVPSGTRRPFFRTHPALKRRAIVSGPSGTGHIGRDPRHKRPARRLADGSLRICPPCSQAQRAIVPAGATENSPPVHWRDHDVKGSLCPGGHLKGLPGVFSTQASHILG